MLMRKIVSLIFAGLCALMLVTSCQKDEWNFDYPQDILCGGTRVGTAVRIDGSWIDITSPLYSRLQFTIRFNTDGTYYGTGYFGNGSGTYTLDGKNIYTYVDSKPYYNYTVKSMTGTEAELTMSNSSGSSTIDIRVMRR